MRRSIGILTLSLVSAACSGDRDEATLAVPREPTTVFDWCTADETESDLAGLMFRKLARPGAAPGSFIPDLAASWEILPDGSSIRVQLRGGTLWEDGTPLTAADVVFSQERARAPGSALAAAKRHVLAVEAEGRDGVVFRTRGDARAALAGILAGAVYPAHLLAEIPVERLCSCPFNRDPVGSGPFRLEGREAGTSMRLVRIERRGIAGEPGFPRLSRLDVRFVQDRAAIRDAIAGGDVDYVELLPGEEASRFAVPGATRLVEGKGRSLHVLAWNTARRPFDRPGVRRAVAAAVAAAADGARARQAIEDAGLRHNAGGDWLGADGRPILLSLMHDADPASRAFAASVSSGLVALGFAVESRSGSPEELRARARTGDWTVRLLRLPAEDAAAEPDWTILHAASSRAIVREGLAGPEENPRRPLAVIERWGRGR